ncbi:hypothetical protein O4215_20445 [Rhodococcus maanshanensis]|uniref:hypothetical protein n=1 Tax=Rhodococcus maanshanensis TaxID=183556 RepID=UPI0022B5C33E|nr:hypothetical protein [Rhodococcus maanshanensis]MCZ4557934.1 hypothetical protein [Rhodococcus maanshanensis]
MNQPMTRDEILTLLQHAQAYDARHIDDIMRGAWHDAAVRARWNRDDALTAVREHYSRSTDRIQPGNVTTWIRAQRSGPARAGEVLAALGTRPASAEHRAAIRAELDAKIPRPTKKGSARRRPPRETSPTQGAGPDPVGLSSLLSAAPKRHR